MLREQFDGLMIKLNEKDDKGFMESVHYAIESCGRYIEAVNAMESVQLTQRILLEPEEYRAKLIESDKRRKNVHDGLIANVTILNRLCIMADLAPIYKGDVESRIEIAEFAMAVVTEMFNTRKL